MIGFAIAAILSSPVVFLLIGFVGVSRKRAEEGREHLQPPISGMGITQATQSVAEQAPTIVRSVGPSSLPVLDPTQGSVSG